MINLIEAVKLLNLNDDCIVNFSNGYRQVGDPWANVGLLRKYVDMRKVVIRKIGTGYYPLEPCINWEFIVSDIDYAYLKKVLQKRNFE